MPANDTIRSRANPLLKRAGAVLSGREAGTIVLEGDRLVEDALAAGVAVECVLVADDREDRARELEGRGLEVRRVEAAVLGRVSGLGTSPGILALAKEPASVGLSGVRLDERTVLLVAAGIADPGNLGAVARSAEAFGARALFVTRGSASPWGGKALRGSMGSLLRLAVGYGVDAGELAGELEGKGVRQVCAATRGGTDPMRVDWRGPVALWVGSETGEMPEAARGFEKVTIPMAGEVESLNVAVAASLLLFASGRAARDGRRG